MKKRAVLVANGELTDADWLNAFLRPSDTLIAVDGGLTALEMIKRTPNLLIGDLDSVTPEQVEHARSTGVEIRRFPPAKDEIDLELALLAAAALGFEEVVVVAALGKRLDHTLGNLSLLLLPELAGLKVSFEDGNEEVFLITRSAKLDGQPGDTVSLLPLWGEVTGVSTEDLAYPLRAETLFPERTRGISNVMTARRAGVKILSGKLLCIHTRKSKVE